MLDDYRVSWIVNKCKDEVFSISANGINFTLEGDKGTKLEMKPIVPKSIIHEADGVVTTISKNSISTKRIKEKKLEQMEMPNVR